MLYRNQLIHNCDVDMLGIRFLHIEVKYKSKSFSNTSALSGTGGKSDLHSLMIPAAFYILDSNMFGQTQIAAPSSDTFKAPPAL